MPIQVTCSGCGRAYSLNDRYAGQTVRCRDCSGPISVPGAKPAPAGAGRPLNVFAAKPQAAVQTTTPHGGRPAAKLGKAAPTLRNATTLRKAANPGLASWQTGVVGAASLLSLVALAAAVVGRAGASGLATGVVLMGAGIFSIAGGAYGWSWFLDHYKARLFVKLFGRTGTRIVYGLLGGVVLLIGVLASVGSIDADPKRQRFAWAATAKPPTTAAVDNNTAFQVPDPAQSPAITEPAISMQPHSDM